MVSAALVVVAVALAPRIGVVLGISQEATARKAALGVWDVGFGGRRVCPCPSVAARPWGATAQEG